MNLWQLARQSAQGSSSIIGFHWRRYRSNCRAALVILLTLAALGSLALLPLPAAPQDTPGQAPSVTPWYDSRNCLVSDFGDIVYGISRGDGLITELWAMKADGSGKHLLQSYLCYGMPNALGPWRPGKTQVSARVSSLGWRVPDANPEKPTPAEQRTGGTILPHKSQLLDITTGQGRVFPAPSVGQQWWWISGTAISPDGKNLAIAGQHVIDPESYLSTEQGIWLFEIESGKLQRIEEDPSQESPAWCPDSRRVIMVRGKSWPNDALALKEIDTGKLTRFFLHGNQPAVSPDGARLVYAASARQGYPTSGIYLKQLDSEAPPSQLSPGDKAAKAPHWSPNGKRILYQVDRIIGADDKGNELTGYELFAVKADGSGEQSLYKGEGSLQTTAWAPDGKSIYALIMDYAARQEHRLLIAADGSGLKADLGGNVKDSPLTPQQQEQREAAQEEIEKALFQYGIGMVRAFEGRAEESKVGFQSAAEIFSGLVAKYPLLNFASEPVGQYAKQAETMAKRPAEQVLAEACKERLQILRSYLIGDYFENQMFLPKDLKSLETWELNREQDSMGWSWVSNQDREHFRMLFHCPREEGKSEIADYRYTPPRESAPERGAPLLSCPNHPGNTIVITPEIFEMIGNTGGGE